MKLINQKIFLNVYSYYESKELCSNLGGEMVIYAGHKDFHYRIGDPNFCSDSYAKLWIPVVMESYDTSKDVSTWVDDRPSANRSKIQFPQWAKSQPNSMGTSKCVSLLGDKDEYFWNDKDCEGVRACSACNVKVAQTYFLRGPELYDQKYSLAAEMQNNITRVVFEGQGSSQIIWYPLKEMTKLVKPGDDSSTTYFDQNPFGLLKNGYKLQWGRWGTQKVKQNYRWIFTNVRKTVPEI